MFALARIDLGKDIAIGRAEHTLHDLPRGTERQGLHSLDSVGELPALEELLEVVA